MKTLYFDCFSGIAGDMAVGALLDLGAPLGEVRAAVERLGVPGLSVGAERVLRSGLAGTAYRVEMEHEHAHRTFTDIRAMILAADLPERAAVLAVEIFRRIAEVEGALHGKPAESVTFHEVGAADSIADIVGFAMAWHLLGAPSIRASALPWSKGTVAAAHGALPVPAPATLGLLKSFAVVDTDVVGELVTPTGAAILAATAGKTTGIGRMHIAGVGYGAGSREIPGRPNLLRVVLGEDPAVEADDVLAGQVVLMEANIDDMEGRLFPPLTEALFAAGALDVWHTGIQMKKGRPGVMVCALAGPEHYRTVAEVLLRQSTTLGVRYQRLDRLELAREIVTEETRFGPIRFKVAGGIRRAEFEDCAAAAARAGVSVAEVLEALQRDYPSRAGDDA